MLVAEVRQLESVDEAQGVFAGDPPEGRAQPGDVRDVQPSRVDPTYAANDDRRLRRGSQDERVELLAARFAVLLRVVEAGESASVCQREALYVE